MSEGPKPWNRQPGETARQFEAFRRYRDLDPSERSIFQAALNAGVRISAKDRQRRKAPRAWVKWSGRMRWVDRARAWDDEKDRLRRIEDLKAVEAMRRRQIGLGKGLQAKGYEALERVAPGTLTPEQLRHFIVEGAKLERTAYGLAESISEHRMTGKDGKDLTSGLPLDLSGLSEEELSVLVKILRKAAPKPSEDDE